MSLYAISDIHLALGMDKPMDVFGGHWEDHSAKIEANWRAHIKESDTVVIPGDISWAMNLDQARPDLEFIHKLPGIKIISKGNHDYWWSTVAKIETYLDTQQFFSIRLLKNNHYRINDKTLLCGARGWMLPCDSGYGQSDEVIYKREVGRLKLSLASADRERRDGDEIVVAMHYPPLLNTYRNSEFTSILEGAGVSRCIYGHVHRKGLARCFEGEQNGVIYINASADKIGFNPLQL